MLEFKSKLIFEIGFYEWVKYKEYYRAKQS